MLQQEPPLLDHNDFEIDESRVAHGGYGSIHKAKNKKTSETVAMKFFGYTAKYPLIDFIKHELNCMMRFKGKPGGVQLIGMFYDTSDGLVEGKKFPGVFPVIVMEYLEGGDLCNMVINRLKTEPVNEKFLAQKFRSAMEGLLTLHNEGFLHRDLKLENLVLTSSQDDAVVKLIDYGCLRHAPDGITKSVNVHGTLAYIAPETVNTSLGQRTYSTKTDVWQAGCVLYILLSAHLPFNVNESDFLERIANGRYFPLESKVWQGVSPEAKSLVRGMLMLNPTERLSVTEVLQHRWICDATVPASTPLGNGYKLRMEGFDIRRQLKIGFEAGKIEETHRQLKENFQEELSLNLHADDENFDQDLNSLLCSTPFQENLKLLKNKIMERIDNSTGPDSSQSNDVYLCPPPPALERERSRVYGDGMSYDEFRHIVTACNLKCLATPEIFSIFDTSHNGNVSMKEFLLALMALRSLHVDETTESEEADLYFQFFDMNEDGFIDLKELRFAFNCLFQDGCVLVSGEGENDLALQKFDADQIFDQIDKDGRGKINIDQFRDFYKYVLHGTSFRQKLSTIGNLSMNSTIEEYNQEQQLSTPLSTGRAKRVLEDNDNNSSSCQKSKLRKL